MNKEVFIAVMVVVAIVVALAFTQINLNTTAASTDKNINNNTGEIIVTIQNGTFNPANLTVKAGTRVTWIVKDDSNNKYMVTSNANGSVEGKYLFMSDH
ncbi:cupredoxin domain-containing protein, partial [Methanobacterium sp.]|uniref:cupredoxin domain-containing protein n=1 Tax=Methanobacterium sp. TaxID=2164 RepID=UPI003C790CE2